jgi:hypothetical protein
MPTMLRQEGPWPSWYIRYRRKVICSPLSDRCAFADIGTKEVQTFLNAKNVEGLSWWTRKALQAVISSVFTKAEDWGYWEGMNPARRTTLGRRKPKRERRI